VQVSDQNLEDNEGLTALRVMYELNPEGVVFTHADEGRVLAANPSACAILGMSEEEILRRGRDGIWDPDDARWVLGYEIAHRTGAVVGSARVHRGDGGVLEVEVNAHHFTGADGMKWGCVIFRDVTTQVDAEARVAELTMRLEQLSVGDELTGLTNRRGLATAGTELLEAADQQDCDMQVLFVDVRALSDLNERLGHEAGDAALQAVARALRVTFRRSDVVARIGGTLFTVLALDLREDERDGVEKRIMEHLTNVETVRYVGDDIEVRLGWTTRRPGDETALEELIGRSARSRRTTAY
jgi:diguanylate cyclase (GGDEF)-like protein/PAS domain S-box-containing protein